MFGRLIATSSTWFTLPIRLALGATPRKVVATVMRAGLVVVALGIAIGLAGALLFTRFMGGLLFNVAATDAVTFASIAVILAAIATAAIYLPARRAARVDPLIALRTE